MNTTLDPSAFSAEIKTQEQLNHIVALCEQYQLDYHDIFARCGLWKTQENLDRVLAYYRQDNHPAAIRPETLAQAQRLLGTGWHFIGAFPNDPTIVFDFSTKGIDYRQIAMKHVLAMLAKQQCTSV